MQSLEFKSPDSLQEACSLLADTGSRPIAGGTDVIPQMRDGRLRAGTLVDLSRIPGLSYIEEVGGEIAIGSMTTHTMIVDSPLIQAQAPFLSEVCSVIGGVQTQNRGTLGGNIANASPAGDTLPVLLALDAVVDLTGHAGDRSLPLAEFLLGPSRTSRLPGEVIRQVRFAPLSSRAGSLFLRLGNRRGMLISIVSAAFVLEVGEGGRVEDCRIALGAVAPTPIRCPKAEAMLLGRTISAGLIEEAAAAAVDASRPIDDVRATAAYRRHIVRVLVRRGLTQLAGLEETTS